MEIWDLWYPEAGASGLPLARCRIEPADAVLVHAAPDSLRVEVRTDGGERVAFGGHLGRAGEFYPMTRLRRSHDGAFVREDGWPDGADVGRPVILAGGEAGLLKTWWNAADGSEWRWTVEFYNRR